MEVNMEDFMTLLTLIGRHSWLCGFVWLLAGVMALVFLEDVLSDWGPELPRWLVLAAAFIAWPLAVPAGFGWMIWREYKYVN
jgi:hypothetical protein